LDEEIKRLERNSGAGMEDDKAGKRVLVDFSANISCFLRDEINVFFLYIRDKFLGIFGGRITYLCWYVLTSEIFLVVLSENGKKWIRIYISS
jgi:hypothetical protein